MSRMFDRGHIAEEDKKVLKEVYKRTCELIDTVKDRGRFIIGTSDFITNGTPYENLRAFVSAAREHGRF